MQNLSYFTQSIRLFSIFLCVIFISNSSCKKFVNIDAPKTSINGKNVFSSDATAIAVLNGIYINMAASSIIGGDMTSIGYLTGLSGDELTLSDIVSDDRRKYYQNMLDSGLDNSSLWLVIYPRIYILNSALEGITASNSLTPRVKKQLIGEVKFLRAFCYFYLVNLYGDVPLVLQSDYSKNKTMARTSKDLIWNQIVADLKDAKGLLSSQYVDGGLINSTVQRVRPNKWAAAALLARAYLYTSDWKNADSEVTSILNEVNSYHLESLKNVFLNTSSEAIWQLQPVTIGLNTLDAPCYVIPDAGPIGNGYDGGVYLSDKFIASFEDSDKRRSEWVRGGIYKYVFKYKIYERDETVTSTVQMSEYHTVLRLAEQYLIRSEARAKNGDISGAIKDVDVIRNRAGLPLIEDTNPNISQNELLIAILNERRHELFTEWGHRWLDLKRTQSIDEAMVAVAQSKNANWNTNWQLYPIPFSDIKDDSNIIQNSGY